MNQHYRKNQKYLGLKFVLTGISKMMIGLLDFQNLISILEASMLQLRFILVPWEKIDEY